MTTMAYDSHYTNKLRKKYFDWENEYSLIEIEYLIHKGASPNFDDNVMYRHAAANGNYLMLQMLLKYDTKCVFTDKEITLNYFRYRKCNHGVDNSEKCIDILEPLCNIEDFQDEPRIYEELKNMRELKGVM